MPNAAWDHPSLCANNYWIIQKTKLPTYPTRLGVAIVLLLLLSIIHQFNFTLIFLDGLPGPFFVDVLYFIPLFFYLLVKSPPKNPIK